MRCLLTEGYSPKCLEGVSLLKKSALSWLRPQIGLETPQNGRIWCPIWGESGHQGSFSTRCHILGSSLLQAGGAGPGESQIPRQEFALATYSPRSNTPCKLRAEHPPPPGAGLVLLLRERRLSLAIHPTAESFSSGIITREHSSSISARLGRPPPLLHGIWQ